MISREVVTKRQVKQAISDIFYLATDVNPKKGKGKIVMFLFAEPKGRSFFLSLFPRKEKVLTNYARFSCFIPIATFIS